MNLSTCVGPSGHFIYGIHKPCFEAHNFRQEDYILPLGRQGDHKVCRNEANFPEAAVNTAEADWIFEIPNAFPFKGATYISRSWARARARNPLSIMLPRAEETSLLQLLQPYHQNKGDELRQIYQNLPKAVQLALATTSTDAQELIELANIACDLVFDPASSDPQGLKYQPGEKGMPRACIHHPELFEAVANNPHLPDLYKETMLLRPGVQGGSEIVGDWSVDGRQSHVFEYLRANSYIPWGHYAANMAHDAVRYHVRDLSLIDMRGMRHLYYQRTYARLAPMLGLPLPEQRKRLTAGQLESLRLQLVERIGSDKGIEPLLFDNTLWGWNFGFDFAPTGYRLHASHQQIHQQFAMIPAALDAMHPDGFQTPMKSYACGDLIQDFIQDYYRQTGCRFFEAYIQAIRSNRRMDDPDGEPGSLIVHEDDQVILFAPKAQTSQWELQLMPLHPVGNILEADTRTRASLDRAILLAVQIMEAMGAKMITTIEYSKRFHLLDSDQHLLYVFLPRIPWSPGAFSEAQLRWINGHYPEDFAAACRHRLKELPSGPP